MQVDKYPVTMMALSLFAKKQPVDHPIADRGGKEVLRQAIALRVRKKENLQALVLTFNAPQDKIIEFAGGADNLNEAQLSAVAPMCLATPPTTAELTDWSRLAKPATSTWAPPAAFPSVGPGVLSASRRHGERSESRPEAQHWDDRHQPSLRSRGGLGVQRLADPPPAEAGVSEAFRHGA